MTAVAKRERWVLRRPKTITEKTLARLAAHPKIRTRFSAALSKPIFPKDIYISGPAGKYVHFTLLNSKKFDRNSFRMKSIGDRGTKMVVGCPAGQWNGTSCRVGMKAQAILVPKDRVKTVVKSVTHTSRFSSNPLLMTVMNPGPGYKKNPVDVEYEAGSKQYRVYRTNKGRSRRVTRRYKKNGMLIPLWNNPDFGKLKVESFGKNPMNIALQTMPILNDNPKHQLWAIGRRGPDGYPDGSIRKSKPTAKEIAILKRGGGGRGMPELYGWDAKDVRGVSVKTQRLFDNPRRGGYDEDDDRDYGPDDDDDRSEFADPGGGSALRAASPTNPRNLPCPKCGAENVLTPEDRMRGYQCDRCADRAEGRYMENPCGGKSYCSNPSHAHNLTPAELAGADTYDENPSHASNLTAAEMAGVDAYDENPNPYTKTRPADRPYEVWMSRDGSWKWFVLKKWQTDDSKPYARWYCLVKSPYMPDGEYGDVYVAGIKSQASLVEKDGKPVGGFKNNPGLPGYFGGVFGDNARRGPDLREGTFVRNLKRVMKGNEIQLDAKSLGRVEASGQFMGDTVYTVRFYCPDGSSKALKFFKHELSVEPSQIGYNSNPFHHAPAGPRALQRHQRGSDGRTPKFGEVHALHKQPASRPGPGHRSVKKVKIPLPKFEIWLKQNGSTEEKHRYNLAKVAYRRFHKGADPEFITRRVVDVGAGKKIVARSFAYSMGKSPFEPYITPKGSGKGPNKPYLHEYETMPEGVTVPGGKVVIKPLDGATKITDWIHR